MTNADDLVVELQKLCAGWLAPHLEAIRSGQYRPRPKVVNDALWGSIRLYAWEVAVLDSYLLQRLRFLRQLGVVHWVYPSAHHSRVEHSLGALHQMSELLAALERNSTRAGEPPFDDATAKLMRLAALVHDCGHTVMSHVSEAFVEKLNGVAELRSKLQKTHRTRKLPSSSEAFAAVFVCSPAFKELLELPAVGADFINDVSKATEAIATLILGGPALEGRAYLTQLISGAFDADKLDYMPRDCLMAGVPSPLDVRRVIEKVRVFEVPHAKLPEAYIAWASVEPGRTKVLALSGSGRRALAELSMARTILYEKVYYHHKVRALEVMVRRALPHVGVSSVTGWLDLVDDDLMSQQMKATFAHLQRRTLLKRALVLPAPIEQTRASLKSWRQLTSPISHTRPGMSALEALRVDVVNEAKKIAKKLNLPVDDSEIEQVEVDRPKWEKLRLDEFAYVGDSAEEMALTNSVLTDARPEAGKHAIRQVVYFFATDAAVLPVFVAARELLRKRHRIQVDAEAYRATRLDPDAIQQVEAMLVAAKYFRVARQPLSDARLISHQEEALETFLAVAWPRFERLAPKFSQYQSPEAPPIGPPGIAQFLRQFGNERLARGALRVLEAVDIKDRKFLANSLAAQMRAALARGSVQCVCPLGGTGDSSAFLSYLMNDIPEELRRPVRVLELALDDSDAGAIILWDDFCGRSGHASTTIAQWLGIASGEELDERLAEPLRQPRADQLRERRCLVTFALARPTGITKLREFFVKHDLKNMEVLDPEATLEERDRVFGSAEIIADQKLRDDLREFCERTARVCLDHNTKRPNDAWSEEKLSERLLGYGREAHLLVFPYNVPTVTLTILWQAGGEGGWQPLFRRRGKPPKGENDASEAVQPAG